MAGRRDTADGLRRRLQPRAVAARGLGRRRRGDAGGRRQHRLARASSPGPGSSRPRTSWDFDWLDEVMDLLHDNGIAVDLATATASPPPWLTTAAPGDPAGHRAAARRCGRAARQHWRPTSPVFREHALRLVRDARRPVRRPSGARRLARLQRAGLPQRLRLLRRRRRAPSGSGCATATATLDALNHAWGTAFWSQRYSDWEQILPPRLAASHPNPTQQLDFKRFSSDALQGLPAGRARPAARASPRTCRSPPTSWSWARPKGMDYADWAAEVDFVANDHYVGPGPQALDELSFSANLTGNLAGGRPWFLMEHSTSAVNWQPVNVRQAARRAGPRLAHPRGARRRRGLLLPVAAVGGRRGEVPLGDAAARRRRQRRVPGGRRPRRDAARRSRRWPARRREPAPVGDPLRLGRRGGPASRTRTPPTGCATGRRRSTGTRAFLHARRPRRRGPGRGAAATATTWWSRRSCTSSPAALAARLTGYVDGGGHLVTTYFSGIVDENDHIWLGGYPGALRDLLGIRIEEFAPLLDGESVALDNGVAGTLWTDRIDVTDPARRGAGPVPRRRAGDHPAHRPGRRRAPRLRLDPARPGRPGAGPRRFSTVPARANCPTPAAGSSWRSAPTAPTSSGSSSTAPTTR